MATPGVQVFASVEQLLDHLRSLDAVESDDGHGFSELGHGLQCAALLETRFPDDVELHVAGLLHDLAHPWDGPGQPNHHRMGAAAVRPLLGDRVADVIEAHVDAKRYLVAVDSGYSAGLSPGSILTLAAQGGPMTPAEVADAETRPDWAAAVELRRADDGAKLAGATPPGLDHWIPAIRSLTDVSGRHEDRRRPGPAPGAHLGE